MLSISHLSIHFGGHYLFDDISFTIGVRDRIGLVGKNGAGKSTLLKILARQQEAETGSVSQPNDFTVGYLSQDIEATLGKTVYEETKTALAELVELEHKIHHYSEQLATRTDYESDEYSDILHKLGEANEYFDFHGGYTMEGDVQRILMGLGFLEKDLERLVDEFSGGWQMRIELAKMLLRKPDCILLDEPTNHLDIESIQWLEEYLKTYEGSVVLVSHDRAFLDSVCTRTIEITNGNIEDYPASYSRYVVLRQERREQTMNAYKNQQREIAKTEEFIERFRSKANLASRVQSRVKALDRIERIEIEEEDTSAIKFRFPPAPRSGQIVVETEKLTKAYGEKTILREIDFGLERGDRVAFVGKNGEGKTTFSKILVGLEEYVGGLKIGHNVKIGYYAQHQAESLDGNSTVFEIIDNAAAGEMRTRVRSLLGAFLFSGDAVFKKVKVLSGGEKSRLALAKLLLEPINFLVLDEPTNHLDMRAKDVLKQSLLDYDGAMIVVSHDREFLQGLTNKVVEFKNGKLKEYSGDIYDFLRDNKLESLRQLEIKKSAQNTLKNEIKPAVQPKPHISAPSHPKRNDKDRRAIEKHITETETLIAMLEKAIATIENEMSHPEFYTNPKSSASITFLYNDKRKELEDAMELWSTLQEQLE